MDAVLSFGLGLANEPVREAETDSIPDASADELEAFTEEFSSELLVRDGARVVTCPFKSVVTRGTSELETVCPTPVDDSTLEMIVKVWLGD